MQVSSKPKLGGTLKRFYIIQFYNSPHSVVKLEHEIINSSWFSLGEVRFQVAHDVIHVFEQIVSIVSDRSQAR